MVEFSEITTTDPPANLDDLINALKNSSDETPPPAAEPEAPKKESITTYLKNELNSLRERQKSLQEEFQNKNKEMANIRETLLVVSGALQAIEHVSNHEAVKSSST
jgi:molecular chaperone GrpE (heat shock protein)